MMKSRAVFAAGAVFLSAALAASLIFMSHSKPTTAPVPHLKSTEVLTWNCEYPEYKPKSIMIFCGDGGAYIDKITWRSWNQDGAQGAGQYFKNLCEPNCADGKIVHAPVNIRLNELSPDKGKYYLRTLDMSSVSGKDFPWGESGVFKWDVMEFAENMDWINNANH